VIHKKYRAYKGILPYFEIIFSLKVTGGSAQIDEIYRSQITMRKDECTNGLILLASLPNLAIASRIAARSTTAGTPVKS